MWQKNASHNRVIDIKAVTLYSGFIRVASVARMV
jgi:hypothetical protein